MVAPHTTKKSANTARIEQIPELNEMVSYALGLIKTWTNKEISRLRQSGELVITPGRSKNEFIIGSYNLKGVHAGCWTVADTADKKLHDFYDRRAAVYYCIAAQNNQFTRASTLLNADKEVAKLSEDKLQYERTQRRATKEKNWVLYDIMDARLSDINVRLTHAQEQFEKNLHWAKYLKTQDKTK